MDIAKGFENKFKKDWSNLENSFVFRLKDQLSGFKHNSKNPCDFICYKYPYLYLIECKTHKGASLPFKNITQYDSLLEIKNENCYGVLIGIVIWLYEKDKVLYVPFSTLIKMKADGKKSVGIRSILEGYNIIYIPSVKKKVYMDSDYSVLQSMIDVIGD